MITNGDEESDAPGPSAEVIAFPSARVTPPRGEQTTGAVTYSTFARLLGMPREQTTGHWCSRCRMIWYGYLLEVACPTCGNRHG
jgi:hypothetical protein